MSIPSLRNLCIDLIAKQFGRFYVAIETSSDENLRRNLEFLQRTYSSELASELHRRQKLKDKYLEFVINKHLKYFDENWLKKSRYRNSLKDIFCRLPNLTKIYCLRDTDEILENIAKFCPKIAEIDAVCMTDKGIKYLCTNDNGNSPCPELKKISIRAIDRRLTDEGLELLLRHVKSLERLLYSNVAFTLYSIYRGHLPHFENMPSCNLVELNITDDETLPYYDDLFKICLTVCPKLKCLSCCIANKEQLDFLSNTYLEELNLSSRKSKEKINIDSFLRKCGRNLVSFRVYNCVMSISELAVSCPNLKCLVLDDVTFPDDQCVSKAVFRSLVNCSFCQTKDKSISDRALSFFLLSSPNLQEIKFSRRDLSPDTKTCILKCCEKYLLKSISFMLCTYLEMVFVKDILVNCPSLNTLEIWYCPFAEQDELVEFAQTLSNKPQVVIYDE